MLSKKNYKRAKNHVVVLEKKLDNVTEEIKVMKQNKSSESTELLSNRLCSKLFIDVPTRSLNRQVMHL